MTRAERNFDKTPERVKVIEKRSENRTANLSQNLLQ